MYAVNYGYYKNQKVVRTVEFSRKTEDFIEDFFEEEQNSVNENLEVKTEKGAKKNISKKDDFKTEEEIKIQLLGAIDISELHSVKQSENDILKEEDFIKKVENKGGVKKFSDLPFPKKDKKKKNIIDEDYDRDYYNSFDFEDYKE